MVFDLRSEVGDSGGPQNLREVNCQVKSLSDIFISFACQLNKLESVQWNWSPSSWVHGALLAVRIHLAVNSDSSRPVGHISFTDICREKTICEASLSHASFFSFPSTVCLQLWPSAAVTHVWFIMNSMGPQHVVSVYTKQLMVLTIQLFIPWRREGEYFTLLCL